MIQYKEGEIKEFIIRPNSSLSWKGNKIFFFLLFFVSFIIAFSFAMVGMWLIVPFTGLENDFVRVSAYILLYKKLSM